MAIQDLVCTAWAVHLRNMSADIRDRVIFVLPYRAFHSTPTRRRRRSANLVLSSDDGDVSLRAVGIHHLALQRELAAVRRIIILHRDRLEGTPAKRPTR